MYLVDVTPEIENAYRVWWRERDEWWDRDTIQLFLGHSHGSVTTNTVTNFKRWTPIGTAASITFTVPMTPKGDDASG